MNEKATLYLNYGENGKTYRFKVFEHLLGIEQQPGGQNILIQCATDDEIKAHHGSPTLVLARAAFLAWGAYNPDTQVWYLEYLTELMDLYAHGELEAQS